MMHKLAAKFAALFETAKPPVAPVKIDFSAEIQKFEQIPLPNNFIDQLTHKPFEDPVITVYGDIYSRVPLEVRLSRQAVDPVINQPLKKEQLYQPSAEIVAILDQFNTLRAETRRSIIAADNTESIERLLRIYRLGLIRLDVEMGDALCQQKISCIRNNLKIDSKNAEHRKFWQEKGKSGQQIPAHVANMMSVAKQRYVSVKDFLKDVNAERHLSYSSRFFKACFRDETTKLLYNQKDEDLQTFVVRNHG